MMIPGDEIIEIIDQLECDINDDTSDISLRELIYTAIEDLREAAEELQSYAHWDREYIDY